MSFLSLDFVALVGASALLLWSLRGPARGLAFLAANAWYASTFLDALGMVSTALFCAAGYGAVRLVERRPRWRFALVAALVVAFLYMRRYSFLELLLPEGLLTSALATAGLSFLLFKILHTVFDAAGGTLGPVTPLRYANYCLAFTTFLLGPIQRYQDFREQWEDPTRASRPTFEAQLDALNRLLRGLVKKYVVAEHLAQWAVGPGQDLTALTLPELGLGSAAFYLFLYFDFSGYCDVVIGAGALIGNRPPENFYLPFFSPNVSEYWLRVHRSLTTWLTDYVFTPLYLALLRRRRAQLASMCLSLLVTMLVAGLWHGTTFPFVLFGLVHGLYLIGFRVYEHLLVARLGRGRARAWRATRTAYVLGVLVTFPLTSFAYLFFAVDSSALGALLGLSATSP